MKIKNQRTIQELFFVNPCHTNTSTRIFIQPPVWHRVCLIISGVLKYLYAWDREFFCKATPMKGTMKAVILAAGLGTNLTPLTKEFIPPGLPVMNRPVLEHLYNFLAGHEISDVYIILKEGREEILKALELENKYPFRVNYITEKYPGGTAGCLLLIKDQLGDDHFLVLHANQILDFDLNAMMIWHQTRKSWVTIAVSPKSQGQFSSETIETCYEYSVKDCSFNAYRNNGNLNFYPHGIYIFDPRVLDLIPEKQSYVDIKEQLLQRIKEKEKPGYAFDILGYCKAIRTIDQYFQVNRDLIQGAIPELALPEDYSLIKRGIWAGKNTRIDPSVHLIEPVIIGDDCIVQAGSVIVGPASIGDNCHIGRNSLLRESIVWENSRIEENSEVTYSLIGTNCTIGREKEIEKAIILSNKNNHLNTGDYNLLSGDPRIKTIVNISERTFRKEASRKLYGTVREALDRILAFFLLILLSPIFLAIAIAIKFFSGDRGPVFFRQLRCGKNGTEFMMIKFRTMIVDADRTKGHLRRTANDLDGPLFKMANDPRLTRVGRFLRKLSLDELPQLMNICKGEMSLIGPRPLADEEMRFASSWRDVRLRVKPGITGLWQISGRSQCRFQDWIKHDVHYVKNQSFALDCKIILKTLWAVINRAGAY